MHVDAWRELPPAWLAGLDVARQVASAEYRPAANSFRVGSGLDLREWEKSGWINEQDPFGWQVMRTAHNKSLPSRPPARPPLTRGNSPWPWTTFAPPPRRFQWYCRFWQGRRSHDDARQIARWEACAGEKGRWKNNLIAKCVAAGRAFDDAAVSPVVRQTLQHWAYRLSREDHDAYAKKVRAGARTAFIRGSLAAGAGGDKDGDGDGDGADAKPAPKRARKS